jgi:UDP-N-acetylglucosamine--N-acetylmuramyl-(pentapeptide) pyrophosphoryl-undecaprenol N-acetylglucosamine transferase
MSDIAVPAALSVVIAGGGTGGHLYPGLAVAGEIRRRRPDATIAFVGTARGLEARVVPEAGYPLDLIRSAGLKGKSVMARLRGAATLPVSFVDAWRTLSRRRPHVVVGVGGYSSGPVVMLAALRGVPTLVLEQNATPGLTNRLLARWVRAAAVTYDTSLPYFRGRGFVSGNPVRAEFLQPANQDPAPGRGAGGPADEPEARGSAAPRVLVLGGSQGAHAVNVAVVAAAPDLVAGHPGLALVHQTGARDLPMVRDAYARHGLPVRAEPFFDRVADEMRNADLVVGRAGATSLAELAALGKPAVLVPFPAATDDHQRRNAEVLARAGAARMVDERDLTGARLATEVSALLADRSALASMSDAMRRFARPEAAARIVDRVLELAAERQPVSSGGRVASR